MLILLLSDERRKNRRRPRLGAQLHRSRRPAPRFSKNFPAGEDALSARYERIAEDLPGRPAPGRRRSRCAVSFTDRVDAVLLHPRLGLAGLPRASWR